MNARKAKNYIAIALVCLLLLPLCLRALMPKAYAVTQSDIDKIRQERDQLTQEQQVSQKKIEQLKEQKASVLEQKEALDERNALAREQLALIHSQIELYDRLIEEKEQDVAAAKEKEDYQLQRYRVQIGRASCRERV